MFPSPLTLIKRRLYVNPMLVLYVAVCYYVRVYVNGTFVCWFDSREASSQAESQSTPFDILGDIMMGQSLLHMKSDNITIHRDGM